MAIIEMNDLTKSYGKKTAVRSISLSLERGQIVGLLGPNGSGKTTLIKMANGLLQPSEGTLLIDGHAPGPATKALTAYLPDRTSLPKEMTVNALIDLYRRFFEDFNIEKAHRMFDELGIDYEQKLKAMSKGTAEKVQLVLVMSRDAEVYLLDEPIGGVDPAARDYILRTIISNYNENAVVILSTHLIADIESVLDDVVFIQNGQIVLHEAADSIRENRGTSVDQLFREVFKC